MIDPFYIMLFSMAMMAAMVGSFSVATHRGEYIFASLFLVHAMIWSMIMLHPVLFMGVLP